MNEKISRRKKAVLRWYQLGHRRCKYCHCQLVYNEGQPNTATAEHLVPKSQGGTEIFENLIVVCYRCNTARGNKDMTDWVKGKPLQDWLLKKYVEAVNLYVKKNRTITINKKKFKIAAASA